MKKLISMVLVAFVLSIVSVGCGETAKKAPEVKEKEKGPVDKGGMPSK